MPADAWYAAENHARWIGLDVGGANLKAADGRGRAISETFELWKRPDDLADAIRELLARFEPQPIDGVALTMTGELADCYATKADGVRAIVNATAAAAPSLPARVATTDDRWLTPLEIDACPQLAAAANWRVAARLVAQAVGGRGVWIDIGSTTTDLIPFAGGEVRAVGATDTERLLAGELLYSGVRRTPVCALVDRLPYRGRECPAMAEWFATSDDAWLLLGAHQEDPNDTSTADGRPFTRAASRDRLARCLGADRETFTEADARLAAEAIAHAQRRRLAAAIKRQAAGRLVISGEGVFLAQLAARDMASVDLLELNQLAAAAIGDHFPAHAAAVLASRELGADR